MGKRALEQMTCSCFWKGVSSLGVVIPTATGSRRCLSLPLKPSAKENTKRRHYGRCFRGNRRIYIYPKNQRKAARLRGSALSLYFYFHIFRAAHFFKIFLLQAYVHFFVYSHFGPHRWWLWNEPGVRPDDWNMVLQRRELVFRLSEVDNKSIDIVFLCFK